MRSLWVLSPVVLRLGLSVFGAWWARAVAESFDDSDPGFALGQGILLVALPSLLAGVLAVTLRRFRRGPLATTSFVLSVLSWAGIAPLTLGLVIWFLAFPGDLAKAFSSFD